MHTQILVPSDLLCYICCLSVHIIDDKLCLPFDRFYGTSLHILFSCADAAICIRLTICAVYSDSGLGIEGEDSDAWKHYINTVRWIVITTIRSLVPLCVHLYIKQTCAPVYTFQANKHHTSQSIVNTQAVHLSAIVSAKVLAGWFINSYLTSINAYHIMSNERTNERKLCIQTQTDQCSCLYCYFC